MPMLERQAVALQDHLAPRDTLLVGLSALVHAFDVKAPIRRPACVSIRHVSDGVRELPPWRIYDQRYDPGDEVEGHLAFAMRHDELDLLVLKRVLAALPPDLVRNFVASRPTGIAHRQLWYWYEHLLGRRLDLPDAPKVAAVDLLDPNHYYVVPGELSTRHKVRANQLGTSGFCPVIRRTSALEVYQAMGLAARAKATIGQVSHQLIRRAASFMLLADSKASFEIEKERPPRTKLERWSRAVLEAAQRPMDLEELNRLHAILLADERFVRIGLRHEGVFLGEHDRFNEPVPEFIGAHPDDLADLMDALLACNARLKASGLDPVLQAAALAFGFIYIHPMQDGNGRLHRCLIHQVLADRGFTPPGLVFPVSTVMADRIDAYRATLRAHSGVLMPYIEWRPTPDGNVEVSNDTADLYRYADLTDDAEFLYACVARTVDVDLPRELEYLRRHDQAMQAVMDRVAFSDRQAQTFIRLVRQNGGKLPKGRRKDEFEALTSTELADLEAIVTTAFAGYIDTLVAGAASSVTKRWFKKLTATCAQHPPSPQTKPKGSITLAKGRAPEAHAIDQRTYFLEDFFSAQPWPAYQDDKRSRVVKVPFDVTIDGVPYGVMHLDIDHKPAREARQGNAPTVLHWGLLMPILRATNYTGSYVVLEMLADGTYRLTITREPPGRPIP